MSDQPETPDTPADPAQDQTPTPADMPAKPKADTDWQAQARKWEQRAKENSAAVKERDALQERLREFEDRDKTELEKLTERLTVAEKTAQEKAAELLRYQVAAEKQVDPDLLAGTDEESMRAHADRLLAWRGEAKPATPKPDPSQGARGPVDIDAEIADAEANGDIRAAIQLKNRKLLGASSK